MLDDLTIRVDIDELMEKLEAMLEDEYTEAELKINDDGYLKELELSAVGLGDDDNVSYGAINGLEDDSL